MLGAALDTVRLHALVPGCLEGGLAAPREQDRRPGLLPDMDAEPPGCEVQLRLVERPRGQARPELPGQLPLARPERRRARELPRLSRAHDHPALPVRRDRRGRHPPEADPVLQRPERPPDRPRHLGRHLYGQPGRGYVAHPLSLAPWRLSLRAQRARDPSVQLRPRAAEPGPHAARARPRATPTLTWP